MKNQYIVKTGIFPEKALLIGRFPTRQQARNIAESELINTEVINANFEAEKDLAAKGYTRKGFKDEQGVTRHALSRRKIETLYNQLMNFIADCTVEEYKANEQAFTAVKTLLHQRMQ